MPPARAARELTFVRGRRGTDHLYAQRLDGTRVRRVDRLRGSLQDPDWSPDGRQVAFRFLASGDYRDTRIEVMDADGSHLVDLSAKTGIDGLSPSWSPDGRRIAFSGRRRDEAHEGIYVMGADGSAPRRLTPAGREAQYPAWSPDGRRIAFTYVIGGSFDVYVMNADGSAIKRLIATEEYENWPVWSPDGRQIAYGVEASSGSSVWVIDADGSHNRRLFGSDRNAGVPMAWEPGPQIAVNCANRRRRGVIGVCAVRSDGTGFRRLVTDGGFPAWRP